MAVLTPLSDSEARAIASDYALGDFLKVEGIPAGSVNSSGSHQALTRTRKSSSISQLPLVSAGENRNWTYWVSSGRFPPSMATMGEGCHASGAA